MVRSTTTDIAVGREPVCDVSSFFFGESQRSLYGVLHRPLLGSERASGALLCSPFGEEYIRSHRTCAALAFLLAEAGVPTLRFDYYGVGDSQGDLEAATRGQWLRDVETAASELRARAGVRNVSLVGLRFGGTLAALSAPTVAATAMVLWDPVIDGGEYLIDLEKRYQSWLVGSFARPSPSAGRLELEGFFLSTQLAQEIRRTSLAADVAGAPARVLLIQGKSPAVGARLVKRLTQLDSVVEVLNYRDCEPWRGDREIDKGFVVLRAVREIVSWVSRISS